MKLSKSHQKQIKNITKSLALGLPLIGFITPAVGATDSEGYDTPYPWKIVRPRQEYRTGGVIAPQRPRNTASRYHIVQSGDTLSSISQKYYGSTARVQDIIKLNPSLKANPDRLTVGAKIKLPAK